jgi:hypothetical protein
MDNEVSKKMVKIVGSDAYMADACTNLSDPKFCSGVAV